MWSNVSDKKGSKPWLKLWVLLTVDLGTEERERHLQKVGEVMPSSAGTLADKQWFGLLFCLYLRPSVGI